MFIAVNSQRDGSTWCTLGIAGDSKEARISGKMRILVRIFGTINTKLL